MRLESGLLYASGDFKLGDNIQSGIEGDLNLGVYNSPVPLLSPLPDDSLSFSISLGVLPFGSLQPDLYTYVEGGG